MMQQTSLPQSSMDVLVLISAVILREGIALAWLTFTPLLFPDCVTAGYNRGLSRLTQVRTYGKFYRHCVCKWPGGVKCV